MALFKKKIWKNRLSEYPNRRKLTKEDGSTELVTVERSEGNISQEGDAFSEENMNDLETRIQDAIGTGDIPAELGTDIISAINALNTGMNKAEYFTDFKLPDYIVNGGCVAEKKNGWVHLSMYIQTKTNLSEGQTITTLPKGFRPKLYSGVGPITGTGIRYIIGNPNATDKVGYIDPYIVIKPNGGISYGYLYADDWAVCNITYLASE